VKGLRIGSRQDKAIIINQRLWTASGKMIEIYNPEETSSIFQQRMEVRDAGPITCFAASSDEKILFTGHDDGKVTMWDAVTCTRIRVVSCTIYRITSLLCTFENHLWVGYSTGKIYVYEISRDKWIVLKDFSAHHSSPVTDMVVDWKSVFSTGHMTVVSLAADSGQIRLWDGFLEKDWRGMY
jgi:WD40 repeat protein